MAVSVAVLVGATGDRLVPALADRIRALRLGPGGVAGTEMGPLITADARRRISNCISSGIQEGAMCVVDGRTHVMSGCGRGHYLGGTLFDRVTPEMTIYQEEIFGPVLCCVRVSTLDEAIGLINRNEFGNGAVCFTRDGATAQRFSDEVEAGMVGINVPVPVPMAWTSFGGWKSSLFGDMHIYGEEGLRFYTKQKSVMQRWPTGTSSAQFAMPTFG